MYVDPRDDFKAFFVLRPLVRLRGRNGVLGLKCRWRASCAIGSKVVSLKSTLSAFWVVSVVLGGLDDSGRTGLPIYRRGRFRWLIGLPIYMQCRLLDSLGFEVILNFLHLF